MQPIHRKLSVWEDPPEFRHCLCCALLPVLGGGLSILVVGFYLLSDSRNMIKSYLEGINTADFDAHLQVCRNGTLDLCPTGPGIEPSLILPKEWLSTFAGLMIFVGVFVVVICTVTSIATVTSNVKSLFMTLFCLPLVIACEWKLVDLLLFEETPIHETAKDEMISFYKANYRLQAPNDFSTTLNSIMAMGSCCGIRGPKDFKFSAMRKIRRSGHSTIPLEHPAACCVSSSDSSRASGLLMSVRRGQCETHNYTWPVNKEGCFTIVFNYIYHRWGVYLIFVILCLIFLQSLQTILTIFVLLKRKKRKPVPAASRERSTQSTIRKSQIIRRSSVSESTIF